jgi:2-methylcitrate dehydratase PrpD
MSLLTETCRHITSTVGAIGAAVAVGKLMKLSVPEMQASRELARRFKRDIELTISSACYRRGCHTSDWSA